jgi:hypothetical protein
MKTKLRPSRIGWVTRDQDGDRLCQLFVGARPIDDMGEWFSLVGPDGVKYCRPQSCYVSPTMATFLAGKKLAPGDIVSVRVSDRVTRRFMPSLRKRRRVARSPKRTLKVLRASA